MPKFVDAILSRKTLIIHTANISKWRHSNSSSPTIIALIFTFSPNKIIHIVYANLNYYYWKNWTNNQLWNKWDAHRHIKRNTKLYIWSRIPLFFSLPFHFENNSLCFVFGQSIALNGHRIENKYTLNVIKCLCKRRMTLIDIKTKIRNDQLSYTFNWMYCVKLFFFKTKTKQNLVKKKELARCIVYCDHVTGWHRTNTVIFYFSKWKYSQPICRH